MSWMCLAWLAACGTPEPEPKTGDDDDDDAPTDTDVPTYAPPAGLALLFSGTDRVVASSDALPAGNEARTVQAWIRTDVANADQWAVRWGEEPNAFALGTRQGRLLFSAGDAEITGPGMADGRCSHAAVAPSKVTAELIVDNVSAGSQSAVLSTSLADLEVGASLDGMMDEVRVYSLARTPAEIGADAREELSGDEESLVLYWNFNDLTASGAGQPVKNHASATGAMGDGLTEGSATSPSPVDSDAW